MNLETKKTDFGYVNTDIAFVKEVQIDEPCLKHRRVKVVGIVIGRS